jgi:hypothetical protein
VWRLQTRTARLIYLFSKAAITGKNDHPAFNTTADNMQPM